MKHKFLFGLLSLISFSVTSQPIEDCDNREITVTHLLNSRRNAIKYIENYTVYNQRNSLNHTRAYYLNSKTILFIDSFFNKLNSSSKIYRGATLNFTIPSYQTNYEQLNGNQQLIKILPIKNNISYPNSLEGDFEAFSIFFNSLASNTFLLSEINVGQVCPGNCDDSLMLWSKAQFAHKSLTSISPDIRNEDKILFYSKFAYQQDSLRYKSNIYHGRRLGNQQTRSIFFKPETFQYLAKFIKAKGVSAYPLIGVYLGNYDIIMPPRVVQGHYSKDQSTVGFIPLKPLDGKFQPDICTYIEFFKSIGFLQEVKGIENHGSLCPQLCN